VLAAPTHRRVSTAAIQRALSDAGPFEEDWLVTTVNPIAPELLSSPQLQVLSVAQDCLVKRIWRIMRRASVRLDVPAKARAGTLCQAPLAGWSEPILSAPGATTFHHRFRILPAEPENPAQKGGSPCPIGPCP